MLSASSEGTRSNRSWVKSIRVCSIQLPETISATPTPTSFGTKRGVNSWICVIAWNSEIAKPMTSEVTQDRRGELQRHEHRLEGESR